MIRDNLRLVFPCLISLALVSSCQDRLFNSPFDPDAGEGIFEVISTIVTPANEPRGLSWDGSTLWNVDGGANSLVSFNRFTGAPIRVLSSPLPDTTGIAFDGQDLWVCSRTVSYVYKINLLNGEIQKRLDLQIGYFTSVAFANGALWFAEYLSNEIIQVDPESAEILSSFKNPGVAVSGLAFDGTNFWAADATTLTIYQFTTAGQVLGSFLSPGQSPQGLAFDGSYLWNVDASQKTYQLKINI